MELLKNYDSTIEYHPNRANVVVNALSRKVTGYLSYMQTVYYPLLAVLRDMRVRLDVDYSGTLLSSFHVWPTHID